MRKLFLSLIFLILINFAAFSKEAGTVSGVSLLEDISARSSALGGAYGAVADDVNAVKYNPAGLVNIDQYEFQFSHVTSFEDINIESVMLGIPVKDKKAVAISFDYFNYGDFDKTNNAGASLGNFTAHDFIATISFANQYSKRTNIGFNFKYFSSKIENESANAIALDLGVVFKAIYNLQMGFALQNIGTKLKYVSDEEKLPFNLKFSTKYKPFSFKSTPDLYFDFNVPDGGEANINVGVEMWLNEAVALRGGYRDKAEEGNFTAGFGVRTQSFQIDYSYLWADALDSTHRLSAIFRFGGAGKNLYDKYIQGMYDTYTPVEKEKYQSDNIMQNRTFKLDNETQQEKIIFITPVNTIK